MLHRADQLLLSRASADHHHQSTAPATTGPGRAETIPEFTPRFQAPRDRDPMKSWFQRPAQPPGPRPPATVRSSSVCGTAAPYFLEQDRLQSISTSRRSSQEPQIRRRRTARRSPPVEALEQSPSSSNDVVDRLDVSAASVSSAVVDADEIETADPRREAGCVSSSVSDHGGVVDVGASLLMKRFAVAGGFLDAPSPPAVTQTVLADGACSSLMRSDPDISALRTPSARD